MFKKLTLFFVLLLLLPSIAAAQSKNIIVSKHSIMVHQIGKRATFRESIMFSNVGDDVFVGELVTALPSGAYNIMVTMPVDEFGNLTMVNYIQQGDNIYWISEINPHEMIQINVVYQSDVQTSGILQKRISVEKELKYYTGALSIVIIATTEMDIAAPPLTTMSTSYNEEFNAYVSYLWGSNLMPQKILLTLTEPKVGVARLFYLQAYSAL